jgi:hypothetical protein
LAVEPFGVTAVRVLGIAIDTRPTAKPASRRHGSVRQSQCLAVLARTKFERGSELRLLSEDDGIIK